MARTTCSGTVHGRTVVLAGDVDLPDGTAVAVTPVEPARGSRGAALGHLVAETVARRRRDKDPVSLMRAASTGSLADETELAVIEAVGLAVRSSSSVECVNSRVRLVQQHNMP